MVMIGFVRHGITEWNKAGRIQGKIDIPLNDEGIQMSEKLARRLEVDTWSVIYTSPQGRAKQTASIIARHHCGTKIVVDKRLKEIGEGEKEGTTEEERIEKWGSAWRELLKDLEDDDQVVGRAMSFIEEVKIEHKNDKILVVSHGSFIQRILEIIGPFVHFQEEIYNASLTIVILNDEHRLLLYNCVEHL